MDIKIIFGILLAGILSNNYALLHFLGTGAVLENERSTKRSLTLGLGTTAVMLLSTLITWPINHFLLVKVPYLQTMVFVLVVLAVVEALHLAAHNLLDNYCRADFVKLPSTVQCLAFVSTIPSIPSFRQSSPRSQWASALC